MIDEIGRMRYQQAVFDTMMLGLRLGDRPRVLIATTPRTTPFMKKLIAMTGVSITTGSTYDNVAQLSLEFLKKVRELYEGTRLGRQELQDAMILDPVNALFKDDWLVHDEVGEDLIEQVTVGVDPSGRGDEVGIVACALLNDGRSWRTGLRSAALRSGARRWCAVTSTPTMSFAWVRFVDIRSGGPPQGRTAPDAGLSGR